MSPQPGTARHVVGMFLPNALLKALAQVRPEAAMAEGAGAVWTMQVNGNHPDGSPFITAMFTYAGGVGARATKPGLNACSYPTGVSAVPIEVVEASAPIRFREKSLRPDSGGAGAQPGGLGQTIEFSVDTDKAWQLNAVTSRLASPPLGVFGGEAGAPGSFKVNGEPVQTQARISLSGDDVVRLELPRRWRLRRSRVALDGDLVATRRPLQRSGTTRLQSRATHTFLIFEDADRSRRRVDLRRVRPCRQPHGRLSARPRRRAGRMVSILRWPTVRHSLPLWLATNRLGALHRAGRPHGPHTRVHRPDPAHVACGRFLRK